MMLYSDSNICPHNTCYLVIVICVRYGLFPQSNSEGTPAAPSPPIPGLNQPLKPTSFQFCPP